MSDRKVVDQFIDEATSEEQVDLLGDRDLDEEEVEEAQTALNVLSSAFPNDNAPLLKIDGVFGPKTYARFKQFFSGLPKSTQDKLPLNENPLVRIDDKVL